MRELAQRLIQMANVSIDVVRKNIFSSSSQAEIHLKLNSLGDAERVAGFVSVPL